MQISCSNIQSTEYLNCPGQFQEEASSFNRVNLVRLQFASKWEHDAIISIRRLVVVSKQEFRCNSAENKI